MTIKELLTRRLSQKSEALKGQFNYQGHADMKVKKYEIFSRGKENEAK